MPSRIFAHKAPLESLKGFFPTLYFPSSTPPKVFGSVALVHIPARSSSKLEPRALKCLFVGYSPHQKGYICYHPPTQKKYVSLNVTFFETQGYLTGPNLQGENRSSEDQSQDIFPLPKWEEIISVDAQGGALGQGENVEKIETSLVLPATENEPKQVPLEVSYQFQSQELAVSAHSDQFQRQEKQQLLHTWISFRVKNQQLLHT